MARMNVTPDGIDWHRLTEDEIAEVGARIVAKATTCVGPRTRWDNVDRHQHFTDQAGRVVCAETALVALEAEAAAGTFADVLPKPRRVA